MADELATICPAADPIGAVTGTIPTVVCGVLRLANVGAELDGFAERGHISPTQDGRNDWKTVVSLCCGPGVPAQREDEVNAHYTACPLWRAQREAEWANRAELHDRAHREPVLEERQNPERVREALDMLRS